MYIEFNGVVGFFQSRFIYFLLRKMFLYISIYKQLSRLRCKLNYNRVVQRSKAKQNIPRKSLKSDKDFGVFQGNNIRGYYRQ